MDVSSESGESGAGRELAGGCELGAGRELAERYCGQCGQPAAGEHDRCQARATLEPPRYCPQCGRRMVVQVNPVGWTADCSRHGQLTG